MGRLPVYLNVDGDRSIWIHAVSVGEVLAARPLIVALKERFPAHRVFVSTTTMTGNAVARKNVRGTDGLFYAPFDWPGPVRMALPPLRPALPGPLQSAHSPYLPPHTLRPPGRH